jgi:hypothetical protein
MRARGVEVRVLSWAILKNVSPQKSKILVPSSHSAKLLRRMWQIANLNGLAENESMSQDMVRASKAKWGTCQYIFFMFKLTNKAP